MSPVSGAEAHFSPLFTFCAVPRTHVSPCKLFRGHFYSCCSAEVFPSAIYLWTRSNASNAHMRGAGVLRCLSILVRRSLFGVSLNVSSLHPISMSEAFFRESKSTSMCCCASMHYTDVNSPASYMDASERHSLLQSSAFTAGEVGAMSMGSGSPCPGSSMT